MRSEIGKRNAEPFGFGGRALGARHARDFKPGFDARRQCFEHEGHRRATAEAEHRAAFHLFDGARRRARFLFVAIVHVFCRFLAASMARHTVFGIAGSGISLTPSGASASTMALITAAGAAVVGPSPADLMPSGLVGERISRIWVSSSGRSSACGMP